LEVAREENALGIWMTKEENAVVLITIKVPICNFKNLND